MNIKRRGLMLVLSSPSGAGKTSIARALLAQDNNLKNSISVTTRPKRPSEIHGEDYFFINENQFKKMRKKGELLEHAEVFGNLYGTPKDFVFEQLDKGIDVIFDIDWQGTQQIAQLASNDLVTVFILPPNLQALHERLQFRGQDNEETIAKRMSEASSEISHWPEYHYVIVNSDFDKSLSQVAAILNAERASRKRQIGLAEFINQFRQGHATKSNLPSSSSKNRLVKFLRNLLHK
ncbi:MAG: guanylate kinase [Proteobacteria bacterium]|nr:guanylate kinase [Pseudomonadota bacterium]